MEVKKLLEENLKREFSVVVPANDIEEKISVKLKKIGKTAKVPGFRPGKVPDEVLRKKYIKDIMGEVLQDVVTESSAKALNDNKIKPALQPNITIEEFDEGKDLKYKMSLEVMPDIPKVDISKISVTQYTAEISKEDTKELEDNFAATQKDFKPVDRKAKDGDAVLMDFEGFVDGEAFEGGKAMGHTLELGSGQFIPGFEEQLVGSKAGEDIDVKVAFPKDYHSEDLKGKDAVFKVKVHEVQESSPAVVNEEFAKKLGFESLDKMRDTIKSQIESDGENMSRVIIKKDIFDVLDNEYSFDLPPTMVEEEMKSIVTQLNGGQNESEQDEKSSEEIKKEYGYLADRRVKLGLIVTKIAEEHKVVVSQEDVNRAIVEEARKYPGQEMQVFEYFKNNPEQQNMLKGPIIEEKVIDVIIEKGDVNKEKKAFSELRDLVLESNKAEDTSAKKSAKGKKKVEKSSNKKSTAKKSSAKKKTEDNKN